MDLPPELRICVYQHALIDPSGLHLRRESFHRGLLRYRVEHCPPWWCFSFYKGSGHDGFEHSNRLSDVASKATRANREATQPQKELWKPWFKMSPNLLATSKKVHAEAMPILYGQPLVFSDCEVMFDMLMLIGKDALAELRSITIAKWCSGNSRRSKNLPGLQILRNAPKLQHLSVDCIIGIDGSLWDRFNWPKKEAEYDAEFAKRLARRLYHDSYVLLDHMRRERGSRGWKDVLQLHKDNYCPIKPLGPEFHGGVWTEARETRIRELVDDEIELLLEKNV
jgi:hypothetical protein